MAVNGPVGRQEPRKVTFNDIKENNDFSGGHIAEGAQ